MAWEDIVVSSKILGHISAGIYRTTAGALKELVSNAFDADAKRIVITTNWPSFDIITCFDNGNGITKEEFIRMMKGGIGESPKRIEQEFTTEYNRPIIGLLGIGILGIAQICHEFKIISHHKKSKTAFEASIKLIDYLKEKVSELEPEREDKEEIDVGKFQFYEIEYDPKQAGTHLVAADMRTAFVRRFREGPMQPLPSVFSKFLEHIHSRRSVKELGDYWQMVWELTIASPIPYINSGPFKWESIEVVNSPSFKEQFEKVKKTLDDYHFEVVVDGLSLKKPNIFPFPEHRTEFDMITGTVFPINKSIDVYGKPLKIEGYIYLQDGRAIDPAEVRGILIRIRNVAIGLYDSTFLKYPKIEGPRFSWLSGELYVKEGLEHALNIDRDSFNEMHPHFLRIQQTMHELLPVVFKKASAGVTKRSKSKRVREQRYRLDALTSIVNRALDGKYQILEEENDGPPIEIDKKMRRIIINSKSPLWPKGKNQREIAKLAAIAYEISSLEDESERRIIYYNLLTKIISI